MKSPMAKTDLPENLLTYLRAWLNEGGWFTEAQADEILRRCKAEPKLREAIVIDKEMAQDIAYAMGVLCAIPTAAVSRERCIEIAKHLEQALTEKEE